VKERYILFYWIVHALAQGNKDLPSMLSDSYRSTHVKCMGVRGSGGTEAKWARECCKDRS
jgi:hypothetical protein